MWTLVLIMGKKYVEIRSDGLMKFYIRCNTEKKNCLWEKCKHSSRIRSSEVQKYTSEASQERFDLELMFLAQTVNSTMKTANFKISRIWEEALNSCTGWPATPIINAQHASLTNDWQTPEHSKLLTRKPVNTRQKWLWNTKQD